MSDYIVTPEMQELLELISEEGDEFSKEVNKIRRFGANTVHAASGTTPLGRTKTELVDLYVVVALAIETSLFDEFELQAMFDAKLAKIAKNSPNVFLAV